MKGNLFLRCLSTDTTYRKPISCITGAVPANAFPREHLAMNHQRVSLVGVVSRSPIMFSLTDTNGSTAVAWQGDTSGLGGCRRTVAPVMKRCSSLQTEQINSTPAPHLPLPVVNGWYLPPSGASETALELFSAAAEGEFGVRQDDGLKIEPFAKAENSMKN